MTIAVTVWNECRHEKEDEEVRLVYPETIGGCIANNLKNDGFETTLCTLDDPEQGLPQDLLERTDVLIWWAHKAHDEVLDSVVDRVQQRVLQGMGLVVLHSAHHSKLFRRLMGTNCNLSWREADGGERERVWCLKPSHPIAEQIPPSFEIEKHEMYGEPFDIPEPDELIFVSWFEGGEVFRSGCTFVRGRGRIFYFSPGHETFPIYRQPDVVKIISNGVRWANQHHTDGRILSNWHRPNPDEPGAPSQSSQ